MNSLRSHLLLLAAVLPLLLVGCAYPGYPYGGPVYAAPPPAFVVAPTYYPNYGYGYWYGGRFCAYRNGYYFHNGCYYRGNYHGNYHGNYYGYHRGYWR